MKIDRSVGYDLVHDLMESIDIVEYEHTNLQMNFDSLNAHFKDPYYDEFAKEFKSGERVVKDLKGNMRDLVQSVLKYLDYLRDA